MKIKALILFLLSVALNTSSVCGSEYPQDGIYYSFSSFRKGMPELTKNQLFKDSKGEQQATSVRQWFNMAEKYFHTDTAGIRNMGESPVWGYVENGTVYILLNGKFHKILLFGQISYFLEPYPVVRDQISPVVTEARTTSTYRLLDMTNGRIGTFEPGRLETLMREDEELLNEFRMLGSPKIKERKMYSFIERFNKAHPLIPTKD